MRTAAPYLIAAILQAVPAFGQTQELRVDMRIGAVDGQEYYMFHQVRSLGVSTSGTIVVLNSGSSEVRVFGSDGTFRHAFGRSGSGPGEFSSSAVVRVSSDQILVFDVRRAQVFGLSGNLLYGFNTTAPGKPFLFPFRQTGAGWVAAVRPPVNRDRVAVPGEFYVDSLSIEVIDTAGQPIRRIMTIPAQRMVGMPGGGTGEFSTYRPMFEGAPSWGMDATDQVYVTDRETYEIRVYDLPDRRIRSITREHRPVAITRAHIDSYANRVREFFRSRGGSSGADEMRRTIDARLASPRPDVLPALGTLLVAEDGAIWVERPDLVEDPGLSEFRRTYSEFRAPPPSSQWDRFDHTGQFLGTVTLPAKFRPMHVTRDMVTGVQADDFDVEFIVRYTVG